MEIYKNYSLKDKNTFGIDSKAKLYVAPSNLRELAEVVMNRTFDTEPQLILGGGSNMLFVSNFDGLVIHPQLFGKELVEQNKDYVLVKAMAGEDWDTFVEWTVKNGYGGLENLSLVPGTVGACPVQNIGAYGVEVADTIEKVEVMVRKTGEIKELDAKECKFAYRNSIFKTERKGQFIITSVYFKLTKQPQFKTHYGAVEAELEKLGEISLQTVRQAVINIRESKLPDPEKCPNAGSFFKNPAVSKEKYNDLKKRYPEIVAYKIDEGNYKLAAGWMIDYLGWKGKTHGGAAVHDKQALVLVNRNNATGSEIIELAEKIQNSVYESFGVQLEFEVNVVI